MGTSWVFVVLHAVCTLASTLINIVAAAKGACANHTLQAVGFSGLGLMQAFTVIMLCTVRQNSLNNYKRLPIWFVTVGSLFLLSMLALLIYQSVYMSTHEPEQVGRDWSKYIKSLYVVGLCGPLLLWIFIYFLISRLNEKVKYESDPNFLDT